MGRSCWNTDAQKFSAFHLSVSVTDIWRDTEYDVSRNFSHRQHFNIFFFFGSLSNSDDGRAFEMQRCLLLSTGLVMAWLLQIYWKGNSRGY